MRVLLMSPRASVAPVVVMTWTTWSHAARLPLQPAPPTLDVSHRAKVIGPGDVVLVTVVPSAPAATVEGTAFGRHVAFWRNDASAEWRGLVGVPLETGSRAGSAKGRDARQIAQLSIQLRERLQGLVSEAVGRRRGLFFS